MIKKILLLALLVRIIFIFGPYHPDLGNHLDWGNRFWQYGPKSFYSESIWSVSWPNQPPGTMYLWALASLVNKLIFNFAWYLNLKIPVFPSTLIPFLQNHLHPALVKIPSVLAEVGIGWIIYSLIKLFSNQEKKALFGASLFLFNPVTIYNSAIWGQTDGLINFFSLLALFLFFKRKYFWAILSFMLSIYIKLSLIIFLPLFLLLFLREKIRLIKVVAYFLIAIFCLVIISLPFVQGNAFNWLKNLYITRVFGGQGNMLTANAFNLWAIIFGIDFSRPDLGTFFGVTYKYWGIFLFGISYLLTLYGLFKKKFENQTFLLSFVLIALSSFMFLTNMHERYLYPAFPYLSILVGEGIISFGWYFVISFIHLLNLYNLWFYPRINFLINFLEFDGIVKIFSLTLLFLLFFLFRFLIESRPKLKNN